MKKKVEFKVKHIIIETTKEEKELHIKQACAALLKIAGRKNGNTLIDPQQF
jgi:hypothetical protein